MTGLVEEALRLRYSRRQILRRAAALGLSSSAIAAVLAACGSSNQTTPGTSGGANPTATSGGGGASTGASPTTGAPAMLKGTKLNVLAATYFVPAGQDLYKQQLEEWGKENNVEVSVDFVNWPDLQPKIGSAIQGKSGPDIVELWDTWPYLYKDSLVDVHDLAMKIGDAHGGYFDWVTKTAAVDGHWYSIPEGTSTSALAYRISYFEQAGATQDKLPKTWDELFEVGKRLKQMGKPLGQALGHSIGDPPSFCYPYMWSYGAMEVQEDGKTVAFYQDQFVEGMRKFVQAWKDAYDESGLSWDDSTNNRAFLSDQISATFNGSSIYLSAKKDNPKLADDISHIGYPSGPAGRFNQLGCHSYAIMKYSKNQEGAKAFLEWWFHPDRFVKWLEAQQGYQVAPLPEYIKNPI
ncbi:MAG: extracellular solute-binding protein, partial [Thermomicrobiaceae bacterium]|nr:extracellular solute-binding protein [Thermomicrobiaceae bacterium]